MGSEYQTILQLSAIKMAQGIREGKWSSLELVELHIKRIQEVNPKLNALVVPLFDNARKEAYEADLMMARGEYLSPLHGVPITIKESIDVVGTSSTWGLQSRSGNIVEKDDPSVEALRQAGAIILGKTNVMQLLMGYESVNPVYGRSRNPWQPDERSPGGSSGGEAANIAAGGSPLGLGTDVGGSIRTPALFCGIHGLKPTPGRVLSRKPTGLVHLRPEAASMASIGPMARHVEDLEMVMEIISTPESLERAPIGGEKSKGIHGIRIGYYTTDGILAPSAALERAVMKAVTLLESSGVEVKEFKLPDTAFVLHNFYGLISAAGAQGITRTVGSDEITAQLANIQQAFGFSKGKKRFMSAVLRLLGQKIVGSHIFPFLGEKTDDDLEKLVQNRERYRQKFFKEMEWQGVDVLIGPPFLVTAVPHDHSLRMSYEGTYGLLYNYLGMPAGVLSTSQVKSDEVNVRGASKDKSSQYAALAEHESSGLPVGVQIAASPWREDQVLGVMRYLEEQVKDNGEYPVGKMI